MATIIDRIEYYMDPVKKTQSLNITTHNETTIEYANNIWGIRFELEYLTNNLQDNLYIKKYQKYARGRSLSILNYLDYFNKNDWGYGYPSLANEDYVSIKSTNSSSEDEDIIHVALFLFYSSPFFKFIQKKDIISIRKKIEKRNKKLNKLVSK